MSQSRKSWLGRQLDRFWPTRREEPDRLRVCRFEPLEPRRMLAADLHLGAVYYEEASGQDSDGDVFHVSFSGGADGTQLAQLTINTDKEGNGLTAGDPFFDTANTGLGAYEAFGFQVVDQGGVGSVSAQVADGGTSLVLTFTGFDAGDVFSFKIDVDEQGIPEPNAVAEGDEFQGSILEGTFTAENFFDAEATGVFVDRFDTLFSGTGLVLPNNDYSPPNDTPFPVRTAGALANATQQPLPTIAGTVYEDINLDNTQDPGDEGIEGVTLSLFQFNGSAYVNTGKTATTDADGNYLFEGVLPGTYRVVESQPDPYFSVGATAGTVDGVITGTVTSPNIISQVTLAAGDDSVHNDFAEALPASISGRVHADRDGDCEFDPGEVALEGVTVYLLDAEGNRIDETTTDEDGFYSFAGLDPNIEYGIEEEQPDGYFDSEEHAGDAGGEVTSNDTITGITLLSGQDATEYDFCELEPASLSGRVFADRDEDCLFTTGDVAIEGVTVYLLDAQGVRIDETTTDENGQYSFTGLEPGVNYGVEEIQPAGYFDGEESPGEPGGVVNGDDTITQINLGPAQHGVNYDFCEHEPASLSGRVFADRDEDCMFTTGDVAIEGVTVYLLDAQGVRIDETTTDENGQYSFTGLEPGVDYGVEEIQPDGYYDGEESPGEPGGVVNGDDTITQINLLPNQHGVNYDFCEHEPASLSGRVFADRDEDCLFTTGDVAIEGVTVYLLDAQGVRIDETTTDENGQYFFTGLEPGVDYGVEEIQPEGYFDGEETPGEPGGVVNDDDTITQINLLAGQHGVNYDFCEHEPASLTGRVFADDGDCMFEVTDTPLEGVTIYLLDAQGVRIDETTTNAQGLFTFTGLAPDVEYGIEEVQPEGYFDSEEEPGDAGGEVTSNDTITEIFLHAGQHAQNYEFCESAPATISGYVYQDGRPVLLAEDQTIEDVNLPALRNGARTSDDTPLAGVLLALGDAGGEPVLDDQGNPITAITDARGYYEFTGLRPGTYSVFEVQPASFIDGMDRPGTTGGLAANRGTALSPQFLTLSHNFDAIIFVAVAGGGESQENNFSEVTVAELPPPPPPEFPDPPPPPPPQVYVGTPGGPVHFPGIPPASTSDSNSVFVGGGAWTQTGYSWHLSIIDAGNPRGDGTPDGTVISPQGYADVFAEVAPVMGQSSWTMLDEATGELREVAFGMQGSIPVTGDFNGDGVTDVAVFHDGRWYIDLNGNGIWDDGDLWAELGKRGDKPVAGDWDGDGKTDIGIFGPSWPGDPRAVATEPGLPDAQNDPTGIAKNMPPRPEQATNGTRSMQRTSQGPIRADLVDHVFYFGTPTDIPIAGDFNGDGVDTVGVFSGGVWILDNNGDGRWQPGELMIDMGQPGDLPLVGDFNADGVDELGIFRDGHWHLDTNRDYVLDATDKVFELGQAGDIPVVGDWDGDGDEEPGVYRDGDLVR